MVIACPLVDCSSQVFNNQFCHKGNIQIRLQLPGQSCLDNYLGNWESGCNFLNNSISVNIISNHNANLILPEGGSANTALMLSSQTKLLNCQQSSVRKYPLLGACWTHLEEPDNGNKSLFHENSSDGGPWSPYSDSWI